MAKESGTQEEASQKTQGDRHSSSRNLLGAFLCWAVVFADIGTSVYYVPGILYGHFGSRSALFVLMTLFVSSFSASSTPRSRGGTPKAVASSTSPRRRFIPLPACSTPCSS